MKRIAAILLCGCLLLGLCACGSSSDAVLDEVKSLLHGEIGREGARELVQGNLNMIYHNNQDVEYLQSVELTAEEAEQVYWEGVDLEVQFFEDYFGIEYDTPEIHERLAQLYDQIYAKSDFTVGEASREEDGSYVMTVTVRPLDIIEIASEDLAVAADTFNSQYTEEQVNAMTEEAYQAYDAAWADLVISEVEAKLPEMGYLPERTTEMRVALIDDAWSITDDSMGDIDLLMIQY